MSGLKLNEVNVIECHVDFKRSIYLPLYYWKLLSQFLKLTRREFPDAIIVGYPGWYVIPLVKILSLQMRIPLVFDAFVSLYDTYVFDRKQISLFSIRAKIYYFIDKLSCRLADIILLDTNCSVEYFNTKLGVEKTKLKRVFVGSDDSVFYPRPTEKRNDRILVVFWGSYIPLHGLEYIIKAAKLLEDVTYLRFILFGRGQNLHKIKQLAIKLKVTNVKFHDIWIPYSKFPNYIKDADICLGIFGTTGKARRVIPNKVYEALAMQKAVITGNSPAVKEILKHEVHCVLCKLGNSNDLAKCITLLANNRNLRESIATNGYMLFKEKLTPKLIGQEVLNIIEKIIT